MALIGRLFVIFFGFLVACLVAGMIVVGAVLFPEFSDLGAGGVLVGVACYLGLIPFDPATLRFDGIIRRHLEIMTGAGIVAGFIYWMIAGRNAGAWRARPRPSP